MKRRHFIQAATSLALPVVLNSQPAFASSILLAGNWAFFDERFEPAHRTAAAWTDTSRLVAVQGDVTQMWSRDLERLARTHPLSLRGVTAESFHFCLRVLLSEQASVEFQASRFDRNLYLWTMRT